MVGSANTHIGFFANSGSTHWLGWVWGARLRRDGYPDQWRGTPTDLRHVDPHWTSVEPPAPALALARTLPPGS